MGRDDQTDSERGSGRAHNRASWMRDIDMGPQTLADEKLADPNSVGTASDDAGVTSEVHRRNTRG